MDTPTTRQTPPTERLRVAVTGASGRLGQALLPWLAAHDVIALDVREPAELPAGVRFVRADVRDANMEALLRGCDALVHLAFIVEGGSRDPALVDAVNIDGSENVVRSAARAGVDRVVYASSIAAYGFWEDNLGRLLEEDAPLRGNDDFYYSRTKAEVERRLDGICADHPTLAVARLRPTVFTADVLAKRVAGLMIYLSGVDVPLHVTHMDDVCSAFVLALEKRLEGAYNVATEQPLPPGRFPGAVGAFGIPLPLSVLAAVSALAYRLRLLDVHPQWLTIGATRPILVSAERLRRAGWRPRYPTTADVLRAIATQ